MRLCKHLQKEIDQERKRMTKVVVKLDKQLIKERRVFKLDIGAGDNKQPDYVGMDIRATKNAQIVWDCEVTPYPFPDEICQSVLMSHLMEHLNPKYVVDIMNEIWRIMKPGGQLLLAMPYPLSHGFYQDPTHIKSWNETTATYFDPQHFLYNIYKPKPWKIIHNVFFTYGNMEIVLEKRPLEHGCATPGGYDQIVGHNPDPKVPSGKRGAK